MVDAIWNTTTGPPGPTLLYDPPFIHVYGTDFTAFTTLGYTNVSMTWSSPLFNGIPFAEASGTDVTFLPECTVVVMIEPAFHISYPAEGVMQYALGGTVFGTSAFFASAFGYYHMPFNAATSGYNYNNVWTTPPFRVAAGATITLTQRCFLASGTATDDGSQLIIMRVA